MDTGQKTRRTINPRYTANLLSIITFGWTLETFKLGYSRNITDSDLYAPLPEHRSNVLGDAVQRAWEYEVRRHQRSAATSKPSLWRALFRVFGCELMLYGLILAAMEFLVRLQQPLFLGLLLRYYSPPEAHMHDASKSNSTTYPTYIARMFSYYDTRGIISQGEAVFFSFGVVFCSTVNVMVQHPFMMGVMHIGMKMRVGLCSLIYRKALKVSSQAMSESSAGLVVNLMANDVNRFDVGPLFAHYLWIGPVETMIMTAYLYREVGIAAVYGSLLIFAVVPFQIFLGFQTARARKGTATKSDERVHKMKEIVMGMEVIKMYTWEQPFRKIIDEVRREEIQYIRATSYIRGVIMSFIMFTSRFGIFITVFLYVYVSNYIHVETVFFVTCYYNIMKQTMTLYFPQAVGQIAEMMVAVERIRDYLLSEEWQLPTRTVSETVIVEQRSPKKRVTINDKPIKAQSGKAPTLNDASTSQNKLPTKDKEKHIIKSDAAIRFTNASSRWIKYERDNVQNINLVIPVGSLTTVIGAVGAGKSTLLNMILGELPCSSGSLDVSGTVSYASQEPWLFVGSVRQNILFGQPFVKSRYMEVCKVCALERDISLFPHGDKTVVGERGVSLSGGQRARINLARAVYKDSDIYLLDDPLSAVDTQVAKHIFEICIKRYLADKTVVLVTHQLQFIKSVDQIVILEKGKISADGDYQTINAKQLPIITLMEGNAREVRESDDVFVKPNFQQSTVSLQKRHLSLVFEVSEADQLPEAEMQTTGRVNGSVYREYFLAGVACPLACMVGLMFILAQTCASAGDYWISVWSNVEDELTGNPKIDNDFWKDQSIQRNGYMLVFGLITLATIAVALSRAFMFFTLCMRSSIKLHDHMFERISRSPMSFFHANPSGRILNRFSKDMGAVDELLPQAMIDCFQIMLNLVGVLILILLIDITLIIPITACLIIFYIFRVIYIRTTGAVKRLEGITRSPVFGHLNASVLGLGTVRSCGAEALLTAEFDRHQDCHSGAWFLFIGCSRAFGYFLDVVCLLFIVCVTFGCLMKSYMDASKVGLAITQSISLTGIFQWGMRQSAEMENQMTSVERVLEYTKLPQEPPLRSTPQNKPPPDWPKEGRIEFQDLSLRYAPIGNYVLNNLTFKVGSREKIGIVGRTGAGKSSIIQALFRLAYLDGTILIDGVDISTLGLHDLREQISIIPQEPVLFSGTLRKNLDPFDEYSDTVLLKALQSVELVVPDDGVDALYRSAAEGGGNFSVGERQLVCLARAIVRRSRVLLLDEATANVDAQTDADIQRAIRENFKDCTVLTIAHRLNTVIDSDRILVLDAGHLVEYDHPYTLLNTKKSYFRRMVSETGPTMSQKLYQSAAENFKN